MGVFSKSLQKKIGNHLRENRIKKGLSQKEVSDQLGYSSSQFISNIERGLCMPPLKQLKILIQMYDLDAYEIADFIMQVQQEYVHAQLGITKKSGESRKKK